MPGTKATWGGRESVHVYMKRVGISVHVTCPHMYTTGWGGVDEAVSQGGT